jgi:2-methylcitrate dehydratase PrpD
MHPISPVPFLDSVARFRTLRLRDISGDAQRVARQCLLDWFGCALAGSVEPLSGVLRATMLEPGTRGAGTVLGTMATANARDAALINGAAGHALDFDDTHTAMHGHPTAPILPAALALAESLDADGEALVTAFVAGVEVACRLGLYIGDEHYRIGWHPTGTIGTIGAAAACAHLLGLDEAQWRTVIALAGTQAAGLKASFGTMAKPLHAGSAASHGLFAAQLAAGGFAGAAEIIDAPQGLAEAAANGRLNPAALASAADRFLIIDMLFKYHASCYLTHAAINAASELRDRCADGVESVSIRVHPSLLAICAIPEPRSGLELKFSLRGTVAMSLLGLNTADTATFNDNAATDPALIALRDRAEVVTDPAMRSTAVEVSLSTAAGANLTARNDTGEPVRDLDLQEARLRGKFSGLAGPIVGPTRATSLAGELLALDARTRVRALTRLGVPDAVSV